MRELAEIGLQAHWLKMAELVGYDAFIATWRMLCANPALRNDDNLIVLTIRNIRSYDRYQRNRYVDTLVAAGLTNSQIYEVLRNELGERFNRRHTNRLTLKSKARLKGEELAHSHQSAAPVGDKVPL